MTKITGNNLQDLYSTVIEIERQLEQAKDIAYRLRQDAVYGDNHAGAGSVSASIDGFDEFTNFLTDTENMLQDWVS